MARYEMKPILEFSSRLQKAMQSFTEPLARYEMKPILEFSSRLQKAMQPFAEPFLNFAPVITAVREARRNPQALDDAGWVPHYTMPFDCIAECGGDADAIRSLLSLHYEERWPEVRQEIEARLIRYDIDKEAKEAFCEALDNHQDGRYRSVSRLLIPEIERVSRTELHDDEVKIITSQDALRKLAANLPLSSVEPGGLYALNLFRRLSRHMYEHINDEANRQRLVQDPVPNRHAVAHGYWGYPSAQNSLNMIFMTDFIFQVISSGPILPNN